jgi:putative oxygen-independent coproporphyrinogen III oxidase
MAQPLETDRTSQRPPAAHDDGGVGVYLHLPFCERICPYCDFAVVAARVLPPGLEGRYVDALCRELEARQPDFAGRTLESIYFGGGTPSLFRAESIARLVAAVRAAFPDRPGGVDDDLPGQPVETTLELNPSTLECDRLPGFRAAGVDRLSIGVQSVQDRTLKRLGRAHRAPVVFETLRRARSAGFENLSLDLIFALPEQELASLDRDLDFVIDFAPEHVSTYELTFEPDTPFGRARSTGRMQACDEDQAADMIEHIEARLETAGYQRYEISSYARAGRRARHNSRYWQRQAVLGLGMGAHSFEVRTPDHPHGRRRANPRGLEAWFHAVEAHPATVGVVEEPSAATARGEAVFLALRQREGLSARIFEAEFAGPPRTFFAAEIARAREFGWIEEGGTEPGDLRLTRAGRLVADSVAALFVEAGGAEPAASRTAGR